MKIISHSADMDGKLSAFLVAKKFDITNENDFIMTDYGKHDEWLSKINKDEEVVICDFSFENKDNDMKKLYEITNKVIWIDHHESSINDYGDYGNNIPGIRVIGTAACMLTYIYFYILEKNIDWNNLKVYNLTQKECELLYNKAPLLVRLVHDYDVWRFQYGEDTEKFKLGLDSENIESPLDLRLKDLFYSESGVKRLINIGQFLINYRNSLGSHACDFGGFEYELCGKKGYCLNNVMGGSPWFGDKIKEYDFVCSFCYIGKTKEWEYSFYCDASKDTSCFELAKSINPKGGGHKQAAGCVSKEFIFK